MDDASFQRIAGQVKAAALASWFLEEEKLKNELAELQQTVEKAQQAIEEASKTIEATQQRSQHARQSIEIANARKEEIASILSTQKRQTLDNAMAMLHAKLNNTLPAKQGATAVEAAGALGSSRNTNFRKRQVSGDEQLQGLPQNNKLAIFGSRSAKTIEYDDIFGNGELEQICTIIWIQDAGEQTRSYYILRCDECAIPFAVRSPEYKGDCIVADLMEQAVEHLCGENHGLHTCEWEVAAHMFREKVLNCDVVEVRRYNKAVRGVHQDSGKRMYPLG
ncbi:hypothetical protein V8F33_008849 [Rhypophila sp. PSN 637]